MFCYNISDEYRKDELRTRSVGLVTEYNPLRNGHQYHINQSRRLTNADVTTAIMGGNFVIRDESAIYNKLTRAKMVLSTAGLAIELPATAGLSSDDHFARLAVRVADYMSVDTVASGSEDNNIKTLKQLVHSTNEIEQSEPPPQKVREGKSYPRIINELLEHHEALASPDDILGISYLRATAEHAKNIDIISIKREDARHYDSLIQHYKFASGISIRTSIISQDNH